MLAPIRDSVFISYSRRDTTWVERIVVYLKPFIRDGSLLVWKDTYIEVGGLWRKEIDAGLQRAAVGLLLVSPNFLASDFIMDEELPALVDAAEQGLLKLVWVPISASHWRDSPLKDYQGAWNPDKPLDSLKVPQRNAALVQITKAVVEAAKRYVTAVGAVSDRKERMVTALRSPEECRPGALHDIPALPPHYVLRFDHLERLRRALLERPSNVMGITGEPYRMGLHGQGGIGKSVLAAALARDEQVRLAFPDGVFWVAVGQAPDVPRLQTALLSEAGSESALATDEARGRKLIGERFDGSAILLILDDVWDLRHARLFDVLGPASRLLVTTRDGSVLTALGAHSETVERLPESAALALLASWAGCGDAPLPPEAIAVARECGYLPLALSVAGARVQDNASWKSVLEALQQGRLEFLDHPYANVFGSLRLSVDALPKDDRQRYLELAVFSEDERVPESVILALWKQTAKLDALSGQTLLARLGRKALLEIVDRDGQREIALHDLQHDFLRISINDLPALHGELRAGLAVGLPAVDGMTAWWRLPPGDWYAWTHLATHLVAAGRAEELRGLLFDWRWLEAKLRASGVRAVLADFEALSPDEDLSLISGALRLSEHVLGRDPGQLRSQLTGRLLAIERPSIHQMLLEARTSAAEPWLRPIVPSLAPPNGALLRTLPGLATAVAVMPDGRRAVSASADGMLRVWNLVTGVEERTLVEHVGGIASVAVTRDGQRAVSLSWDESLTLKVWNLGTGAEEHRLVGHTNSVSGVAVTPDSRCVVSASADRTLRVWNLETGEEERSIVGHTDYVNAVAVTPDGRRVVSADQGGMLKVWNFETGAEERTLMGHVSWVHAVAVTPDGRRAVSASGDHTLKLWDLETGVEVHTLAGHSGEVFSVAVTPEGRYAVSASFDGTVKVWNLETGMEDHTLGLHGGGSSPTVEVTPDGGRIVSGSHYGTVKVWDLKAAAAERDSAAHLGEVTSITVTPNGRRVVSSSTNGTVKVWDLETGAEEHTLGSHAYGVRTVAMMPDGRRAVSASNDNTVKVWDLETGVEERTLTGHTGSVMDVAVTLDGRRAVSASDDRTLKVWDLETGAEERTLAGNKGWVVAVAVTPDGRHAISGATDGWVKLWDLETGVEDRALMRHLVGVEAVVVTRDGRRVVSAASDYGLRVWNLDTEAVEPGFLHMNGVQAMAVTLDSRRAATASRDGTVKVWDLETHAEEYTLAEHAGPVTAVAVTQDGRRVVSASFDQTLKVWDLESGRVLATFTGDGAIQRCAVAPDGTRVVAGDSLGRVHFLMLEPAAE